MMSMLSLNLPRAGHLSHYRRNETIKTTENRAYLGNRQKMLVIKAKSRDYLDFTFSGGFPQVKNPVISADPVSESKVKFPIPYANLYK